MSAQRTLTFGLLAVAAAVAACGEAPEEGGTGGVGFELFISRAAIERVGAFQLALVQNGSRYDCTTVQKTCLNTQGVTVNDLVRVEDSSGRSHAALVVPVNLTPAGEVQVQETTLRNVPTGTDYMLVVEAMSKDSPPRFLGSTCKGGITVRSGNNEKVIVNTIDLVEEPDAGVGSADAGVPTCDPRFEK